MTEAKKKSSASYYIKLGVTLFLICAVTACLLGLVNGITADKIIELNTQKTANAMNAVLPADSYEQLDFSGGVVMKAYRAVSGGETAGFVFEVAPSGFGGTIDMVVGVGSDGTVMGVEIVKMSETAGLGAKASNPEFLDQFTGKGGGLVVKKDIDALTGATITSKAVTEGVNAAVAASVILQEGGGPIA